MLYYLDETGFNLHNGPRYGYSITGTTPYVHHPGNRGRNQSVLVCIGLNGVLAYELSDGAYNGDNFIEFLQRICPLLPEGALLIMDNASFHKRDDVHRTLEAHGTNTKYLPPYSPQLNPIEEFFAMLKSKQSSLRPRPITTVELKMSIEQSITQLITFNMSGFYGHMRRFLAIGLQGTPFL